jgi:cardiolipin synthase
VADKLLVVSSFIILGLIDAIPMWLTVVLVVRDIIIVVGYGAIYLLVEENMAVRPSWIGKWSTTFQLMTLAVALVTLHDGELLHPYVLKVFIALSASATVASGLQYLYRGLVWLQNRAPSITPPG